jgi:hypothetical protein
MDLCKRIYAFILAYKYEYLELASRTHNPILISYIEKIEEALLNTNIFHENDDS